jgi:hypothetical protein
MSAQLSRRATATVACAGDEHPELVVADAPWSAPPAAAFQLVDAELRSRVRGARRHCRMAWSRAGCRDVGWSLELCADTR